MSLSTSTIIELRQESATNVKQLPNGTQQNGVFKSTLDRPITVENGDQITIKAVYLDTSAASSGEIHIQEDIESSITCCMYLQNFFKDQNYPWQQANPPSGGLTDKLRIYPQNDTAGLTQNGTFRGDNNLWWLAQASEPTGTTWHVTGVNIYPSQGSNPFFGNTTLNWEYTPITPGAAAYSAFAQTPMGGVQKRKTKAEKLNDEGFWSLDILCQGTAEGPELRLVPHNTGITKASRVGVVDFKPYQKIVSATDKYYIPQQFTLDFTIKAGDYTPSELTSFLNDLISNAEATGMAADTYAAQMADGRSKEFPVMSPFMTTILKNYQDLNPGVRGYLNLPQGNVWTQAPAPNAENFDEIDLGEVATYRRVQVGSSIVHWFQAVTATNWNIYFTKPTIGQTPDSTAVADLATGVLTFPTGTTFTPTTVPTVVNALVIDQVFVGATGQTITNTAGTTFDNNGKYYFNYPIQTMRDEYDSVSERPSIDRWVGTNQFSFALDPQQNKIKIDSCHFPIYGNSTSTGTAAGDRVYDAVPCVEYNAAVTIPGVDSGNPPVFIANSGLPLRYGGIGILAMKPTTFWYDNLGFGDILIKPKFNAKIQDNGVPAPTDFNSFTIDAKDGVNVTGAYPGLDIGVQHHEDFYSQPIYNNYKGDDGDTVVSISDTTSLFSTRVYNTAIADEGYFKVKIGNNLEQNLIGAKLTTSRDTQSIVNRYYTANSFTSDQGAGSIVYTHSGAPMMLSDFNVEITNPDDTFVDPHILQPKNTVFLELVKGTKPIIEKNIDETVEQNEPQPIVL